MSIASNRAFTSCIVRVVEALRHSYLKFLVEVCCHGEVSRTIVIAAITLALFPSTSNGQLSCPNGASNIETVRDLPRWSGRSSTQHPSAPKQYLFFDAVRDELVVYYPKSLNESTNSSQEYTEIRWQPQFLVAPIVISSQRPLEGNVFEYKYSLENDSTAKSSISWFSIVSSSAEDNPVLTHPAWITHSSRTSPAPHAPQVAIMDARLIKKSENLGYFLGWHSKDQTQVIPPNGQLNNFILRSQLMPGIITAFANSDNVFRLSVEMPPEIHSLIVPFLAPERNFKSIATIGPKFSLQTKPSTIANDFLQVVAHLQKQGCFNGSDEFLRELMEVLHRVHESDKRVAMQFQKRPSNAFESEITNAVKLSLSTH